MSFTFTEWMGKVDNIVYEVLEIYTYDLPDEEYRINYDNGMPPEIMANIVIKNNDYI